MSKQFLSYVRLTMKVMYISLIVTPFLVLYLYGLPEGFERVDPEIVNGLLAGSSLLFGFATLPLIGKKIDLLLFIFIMGDVFLLALCGVSIFYFGLGYSNGLLLLLFVTLSFNANVVTALYRLMLLTLK